MAIFTRLGAHPITLCPPPPPRAKVRSHNSLLGELKDLSETLRAQDFCWAEFHEGGPGADLVWAVYTGHPAQGNIQGWGSGSIC